jgi:hypothetical protein
LKRYIFLQSARLNSSDREIVSVIKRDSKVYVARKSGVQVKESKEVDGLLEFVPAQCTYTSPEAPAADVAAHNAAALALSARVVDEFLTAGAGVATPSQMIANAKALYDYSKSKASLSEITLETNATDTAPPKLGVRFLPVLIRTACQVSYMQ